MTVVLQERRDLTTANYLRVAWRGEPVELAEAASGGWPTHARPS